MKKSKNNMKINYSCAFLLCLSLFVTAQNNQKRDRGESFYKCENSNTSGPGDIWVSVTGVGLVWDNPPKDSNPDKSEHHWISNARGFPEAKVQAGITDFLSLNLESRLLSWGFKPGWVTSALKFTLPNNKELRFHGFAAELKYRYQFIGNPTLGGYEGFMPEEYVTKGSSIDVRLFYELDFLARFTNLPLRFLFNDGFRIPLVKDKLNMTQMISDAGLIYTGYGFDFFVLYTGEFFKNFAGPLIIKQDTKKFGVFFSENPMYLTLGGDVRYDNGLVLSLAIPILTTVNHGSALKDLGKLNRHDPAFKEEWEKYGITDPFDPWYVQWKIVLTLSYPIRFKMSSTEMMRNFLILKNRKGEKKIDIDSRLQGIDENNGKTSKEDAKKRLEEIKKRREQNTKE